MDPNEVLAHLRREPFEPFRICLSDGTSYDIRHPEMALVSRSTVAVAPGATEGELPDRLVDCSPLHITRLEPLNGAAPGNEPQKRRKRK